MRSLAFSLFAILTLGAKSALAVEIVLPERAEELEKTERRGSISLPYAQYGLVSKPAESASGEIMRQSWRIPETQSAYELTGQLVEQYERQGFSIKYRCDAVGCGGFDFRYNIETTPPPDFDVNLEEFYYVDLRKDNEIITILASPVVDNVYLQQIYVVQFEQKDVFTFESETISEPSATSSTSRTILSSVQFASGGATPESYDDAELQAVATKISEDPILKVYIVGHSDQTGSLSGNISITRQRAEAVRKILIEKFSVPPKRILADGVGFLSPIADNSTEAGRAQNRRVEAVYLVN